METVTQEKNDSTQENRVKDYSSYVNTLVLEQREFYRTGITRSFEFRKKQLLKLKSIIETNESKINKALFDDLHRPDFVSAFTTGIVLTEIKYMLERVFTLKPPFFSRRLKQWMHPTKTRSPLILFGDRAYVEHVPKGVVLILGPWNYPFLLLITPLIGAIAGGNCAIVKPSEKAPHTSKIIKEIINTNFDSKFIHVEEGDVQESVVLTNNPSWDHIFFTGGTEIGRIIYQAAAKNLIPVTLELGGKTPTIVHKDVHLKLAVRRITSMKFLNAGQTCMAPDYVLIHKDIKEKFIKEMKSTLTKFMGDNPEAADYARVIDDKQFARLTGMIAESGETIFGGVNNPDSNFIAPTIIDNVNLDSDLMCEEIFGPILPLIDFETDNEVINFIESRPHPLALYIYTKNKQFKEKVLKNTNFGGSMINDSVLYYGHPGVPFGGKGESGMGNYTGKYSFDTFTQDRPVIEAGTLRDRTFERLKIKSFRYPPYKKFNVKLLKLFHRTFNRFRF